MQPLYAPKHTGVSEVAETCAHKARYIPLSTLLIEPPGPLTIHPYNGYGSGNQTGVEVVAFTA